MKTIKYTISPSIFTYVPDYVRGLIIITNIDNSASSERVHSSLRNAEANLKASFTSESLITDARIISWRAAFKAFDMNPSEFRPAHEALARRAVQGKALPFINAAVDIGNAASLQNLMPIGVHPLDNVGTELSLRLANGTEHFVAFGSDKLEFPKVGEVVLTEGLDVFTRCWVWRQAQKSITLPTSKTLVINVDALPPITLADVERISRELADVLIAACGGTAGFHVLTSANPSVSFQV